MADEQKGKLDKDLTDSENINHSTDKTTNAPVIVQLPRQRKRGYLTNEDGGTSASSSSSVDTPVAKKCKKDETHRERNSDNPLHRETTTSDPSQTSDLTNLAGDLPTQGTVSPRVPVQSLQSELVQGWFLHLIINLRLDEPD